MVTGRCENKCLGMLAVFGNRRLRQTDQQYFEERESRDGDLSRLLVVPVLKRKFPRF